MQQRGMTLSTKGGILVSVTLLMTVGFVLMLRKELWIPCGILAAVWLCHVIYFVFGVKTIAKECAGLELDVDS